MFIPVPIHPNYTSHHQPSFPQQPHGIKNVITSDSLRYLSEIVSNYEWKTFRLLLEVRLLSKVRNTVNLPLKPRGCFLYEKYESERHGERKPNSKNSHRSQTTYI